LNVASLPALLAPSGGQAFQWEMIASMRDVAPYIHALKGRLRIKVLKVKGSAQKALELEEQLRAIEGVHHVHANPTTGNVLIRYHPDKLEQSAVLAALQHLGYLQQAEVARVPPMGHSLAVEGLGEALAETLVRTTMELALQRLVSALI
jgi:cation transport ATPase